ncbi:hypothetical protein KCU90_g117, partial [Aureobasidium melanogenum]
MTLRTLIGGKLSSSQKSLIDVPIGEEEVSLELHCLCPFNQNSEVISLPSPLLMKKQSRRLPTYMTWLPLCSSHLPFHLPTISDKQLHNMTEILVLQAQIRENFLATHNVNSIQLLAGYVSNTNPEVWTAKIGHFHSFGQAVTYLEPQGETLNLRRLELEDILDSVFVLRLCLFVYHLLSSEHR